MDKPWLKHYPESVPAEITSGTYTSLADMVSQICTQFSAQPAYTCLGKTLTYAQVDELSGRFAAFLIEQRLQPGDRIALMMPNCLQYPIAMFGALRAGLVVVNVNPLYTARELKHQISDSGATAIVLLENFAHVFEQAQLQSVVPNVILTELGDMVGGPKGWVINKVVRYVKKMVPAHGVQGIRFKNCLSLAPIEKNRPRNEEDIAFLQYTGGTTGVSKGVVLTHGNILANIAQAYVWICAGGATVGKERMVTALPLYHIFALTANCFTYFRLGAHNLLIPNPRDMKAFISEMEKFQPTAMTGVNTLYNALLLSPDLEGVDLSSLRMCLGGGMATQQVVAERWLKRVGCPLLDAYGLTETSPAVCINVLDEKGFTDSVGLPLPSTEVCVRDEQGEILPHGERGELCVRGPQVMRGYWQRPEETERVLDASGWLRTGDVAIIDPELGRVKIVDRLKDMILVSGFNVYPNEIEAVLSECDGVAEVGVVGIADEKSGEAICALVVCQGAQLSQETLHAWCCERLTNYKRPKHYLFVDELPKSNVGKILRREIRDLYAPELSAL